VKSSIVKRSVMIGGHKTSVSLEEPFWDGLKDLAARRDLSLSALLHEIDSGRDNANLSSAIRVYVFEQVRALVPEFAQHDNGHTRTFAADQTTALR
jgi:predicted DNA-binding ribbon-helix-helix protein